jgi:hypothetical protein
MTMSKTIDQGKDEVAKLCRYFTTNRLPFLAAGVKEAHIRQTLIDPLLEALGWDVRNKAMAAPQYREVIPEDSLDVEGQQKAPDYTFRVGTLPKFYIEAKKCGVNIGTDRAPAFQLRRYGWSAKLGLSILTNFSELAIYDCTARPHLSDKASHARIKYFRYDEYPDRWGELWDLYSREAVWSGAFDQYVASKRKRGTSEVDAEFLKEMEGWRLALAGNIALRNKSLSLEDLNASVQLTIDRVVFLRMAEDRGLEPYEQLLKLCERPSVYLRFMRDLCRKADQKYNSGLFHFQKEGGVSEDPDQITPKLLIDDKVFVHILQTLYFAHGSPYDFGVLPVEILGTVYERFLGRVIRLTAGHQAKIEEKPEARKAAGVYYTPAYIVAYIVKQTVGKQIEGRSPTQLAGSKDKSSFRVLDMACGSGSFLLGAYQCLLDHCLNWYSEHKPEAFKKAVYKDPRNGHWRLTVEEKKRILTTHIFGVDIDSQAVEVSKLSLLLKVLEGETDQSLALSQLPFGDRALPNLADNIKCGNSLVGSDYFAGKLFPDPEEMKRINPFEWGRAFPAAMKAGGFDSIIGNPPYIRIQIMKEWVPLEVEIYKELFQAGRTGNYDIYVVFIEEGLKLLNASGQLGFICPHKFFNSKYGEPIRGIIAKGQHLSQVVHFGDQQVFDGPTTYTCLLFLSKSPSAQCAFSKVTDLNAWRANGAGTDGIVKAKQITPSEWNFVVGRDAAVSEKLARMPVKLSDVAHLFVGLQTDADEVFIVEEVKKNGGRVLCRSKATKQEHWLEDDHLKPFLKGSLNIRRYYLADAGSKRLIFPYEIHDGKSVLIEPKDYKRQYPLTWHYLEGNRKRLAARNKGRVGHEWYGYVYKKNHTLFGLPKIVVPSLATGSCFAPDFEGRYCFVGSGGGGGGGYGITLNRNVGFSAPYLLGILNSKLLSAAIRANSTPFRGGYIALNRQYIERLPIRTLDFRDSADKVTHERMVKLVESMLNLHQQLAAAKSEAQKAVILHQIDATDAMIDRLVYDLYGLTAEEIAIVEQATVKAPDDVNAAQA